MMYKLLLVATIVAMADAAALVRFINTVPTRTATTSVMTGTATGSPLFDAALRYPHLVGNGNTLAGKFSALINKAQGASDRVGLYYYNSASTSVTAPTVVWTQLIETGTTDVTSSTAPYYWYHGMPALRPYHYAAAAAATATETVTVDRPLGAYQDSDNGDGTNTIPVHAHDIYDVTRLKADGVGNYLSFAAGTYNVQAYCVMSNTASLGTVADATAQTFGNAPRTFTTSSTSITLKDNTVYTLIAYGYAAYGAQIPLTGATVQLALLQESVASTTFGYASLRFFHAVQTESANVIDVYQGSFTSNKIAPALAFGAVSNYVDVAPGLNTEFPVAVPGSTIRPIATGTVVQRDVRAGLRATVICANTDETTNAVFCRAIPSRAVAYVRLVVDTAGQNSLVTGKLGPQKLSATALSLWASYEVPRPEQVTQGSQILGNAVWTNHPATTEGLYPVVQNVASGSVSGYGEVFVPLFIMDFAIRPVITSTYTRAVAATTAPYGSSVTLLANQAPFFNPTHKRVHFVLKTDGYATLSGQINYGPRFNPIGVNGQPSKIGGGSTAPDSKTANLDYSVAVDEYIEPGAYYSVFAYASNAAAGVLAGAYDTTLATSTSYDDGAILRIGIRLDRTVTGVASGISSNQGILTLVPFVKDSTVAALNEILTQNFAAGTFTLQSGTTIITPNLANVGTNRAFKMADSTNSFLVPGTNTAPILVTNYFSTAANVGDGADIVLSAATYTYSFVASATPTAPLTATYISCYQNIPTGGSVTVTAGTITDLFVLGAFSCQNPNAGTTQNLQVVTAVRQSAVATGHSPWSSTKRSVESAVPLYNSASSSAASILFALFAAIVAVFAL